MAEAGIGKVQLALTAGSPGLDGDVQLNDGGYFTTRYVRCVTPGASTTRTRSALATGAVFARTTWAWRAAIVAHAIAVAGVLLGIVALAAGAGPTTPLNFVYHRAILSLLIVGAIVVATGPGRRALLLDR